MLGMKFIQWCAHQMEWQGWGGVATLVAIIGLVVVIILAN